MIELRNLCKKYRGVMAIENATASVGAGAIGLLGPNGAGKSTLIKVIMGLVRVTSGQALVFGHDVRKERIRVREIVGYMPEDDCHFPSMSGVMSVAYSGELGGLPWRTAIRRAHEILDFVTVGEERYREVQTYSTGMKQKIKLAQSLMLSPKLVFLDEPTSGLDPVGRAKMLRLIRSLWEEKGINIVISTHILSDVERCCDAILIMGKGRILRYGPLDVLRQPKDLSFRVAFEGNAEAFIQRLQREAVALTRSGEEELEILGPGRETSTAIFRAAAETDTRVRRIMPKQLSLEELFLEALKESPHANL